MPLPPARPLLLAALLIAAGAPVRAQDAPPPPEDRPDARENPLLTDRSLERDILERSSRPESEGPLLPSRNPRTTQVVPNQPADPSRFLLADGAEAWTSAPVLMPEGTFLVGRVGQVVRLRLGGLAFLPAPTEEGPPEPALVLLPCEVYGRISTLLGQAEGDLWLALTGEVFEYRGRNYLLPSAFASETGPETPQDAPETEPEPQPEPHDGAEPQETPPTDDRIEDLVRQLEAERAERRGIETVFEDADEEATAAGPRADGRMLLSRRARMVRSAGGGWVVAIDNDTDGPAGGLPERLHLMPCRVVAEMERQAERLGDAWTFEVSGNLYRLGGRVFLMPRLFVSQPRDEVEPLQ